MSTALKLGIGAAIVGIIVLAVKKAAKHVAEGISFKIRGFEFPELSGAMLTLPINVLFKNDSPVTVPIDRLQITLSYLQNGQYIPAGTVDQRDVRIAPGENEMTFMPVIDLKALFSNFLNTITTALQNKSVDILADVIVTVKGIEATETVQHRIKL